MGQGAGSRAGAGRFQAMGQLDSACTSPPRLAQLQLPPQVVERHPRRAALVGGGHGGGGGGGSSGV
jgi:hypothetical protein